MPHESGDSCAESVRFRMQRMHIDHSPPTRQSSATVPAAAAVLLLVRGRESPFTTYKAAAATPLRRGQPLAFLRVAARAPIARVQIVYTNPGKTTLIAELRVNGRIATRIAFPPTGNAPATVTVQSQLDRPGAKNELVFSALCDPGPEIQSISVQ